MRKIIIIILIAFALFGAYESKPDDKTCIIQVVKSVWGKYMPDLRIPMYYEQFMNETSKQVEINDWVFLKRIKYNFKDGPKTVGLAAFNRVFTFGSSKNN